MRINAIVPWFGSKRYLAPRIVEQLGPHRAYWEPFCGSLAVLLAKPVASQETVCDLHADLTNLARVIQNPRWGPWLFRRLRRCLVHEDLFWEAAQRMAGQEKFPGFDPAQLVGDEAALRACDFFYTAWMGRNGVIGTKQNNNNFCVRYTSNGGIQGTRYVSAVDSIPAWRRRLAEVTILSKDRDGFVVLQKIEDQRGTAIYADPPYLQKGATYVHDFTAEDHARLARILGRFQKARVVVSYYDAPELDALYPGWTKIDCAVSKSLSVQGKRGSTNTKAPEVLLVNGPAYGAKAATLFDTQPESDHERATRKDPGP
jgi:DNA adenine methylase